MNRRPVQRTTAHMKGAPQMLDQIVTPEDTAPVSARAAADRFPPVLDNPTLPVTRGSLARFMDLLTGKGRAA